MKPFDNTIEYHELLMKYDNTKNYIKYNLPNGYHFEYYKDGDMNDWIKIHLDSREFTSFKEGKKIFHDFYDSFISELNKRCIFIIDDKTNEKVATVTVSLLSTLEYGYNAAIDWLAIKEKYQGKHLSKPLLSKMLEMANNLGHDKIILHTQTTTWLAAKLYLDYGFEILNKSEIKGWSILKTLTNHPKLLDYKTLNQENIYDQRIVKIKQQLDKIFNSDNYNYSVWYKNGMHNVYVYYNNKSYEYLYYEDNNKIRLEEVV